MKEKTKIVTEICFARFSLYNLAEFDIDLNKLNSYTYLNIFKKGKK